jgi:Kdo2-lipid IVA lauroyltransferase/acyltransferase
MSRLLYYMFIWPLSRLPLRFLYGLSGVLYLIGYRVVGYRKGVVRQNMERSFPEKTPSEIKAIMHRFYRHFFDTLIESLRGINMPRPEYLKRVPLTNPEILDPYFEKGKSVMIVAGHYNNWEWSALALAMQLPHDMGAVYKPLRNAFFDDLFQRTRSRFGMRLINQHESARWIIQHRQERIAYYFLSDQSPTFAKKVHWTTFLNQDTAVFMGAERIARRFDMPLFFIKVHGRGRGQYAMTLELLEEHSAAQPEGVLTELHVRKLEEEIQKHPETWLWTHKRWKRRRSRKSEVGKRKSK